MSGKTESRDLPLGRYPQLCFKYEGRSVACEIYAVQVAGIINAFLIGEVVKAPKTNYPALKRHRHHSAPDFFRDRKIEFVRPPT